MGRTTAALSLLLVLLLSGCATTKRIAFVDSRGNPVAGCYVFARQQSNLYPNSSQFVVADRDGIAEISFAELVCFYAGKEDYLISSFHLVGENHVRVVMYSPGEPIAAQDFASKGKTPEEIIDIARGVPEAEKLIPYFTSTPVIMVSPQPMGENRQTAEVVFEKCNSREEWRVKCNGISANEKSAKWLVIGNEKFQIRQPLTSAAHVFMEKKIRQINGKLWMEISFSTDDNEGVFLLPADRGYFMYDSFVVRPGKRNIWISDTVPETEIGITCFGGRTDGFEKNAEPVSVCVWLENTSQMPEELYRQERSDVMKILKPPVAFAKNAEEFIDYKGVPCLSPLLAMRELSACGISTCDCTSRLRTLQDDLCYDILRFDNGSADLSEVLESCGRLYSFYSRHASDAELKKVLDGRLEYIRSMISRQKQFEFESGIAASGDAKTKAAE